MRAEQPRLRARQRDGAPLSGLLLDGQSLYRKRPGRDPAVRRVPLGAGVLLGPGPDGQHHLHHGEHREDRDRAGWEEDDGQELEGTLPPAVTWSDRRRGRGDRKIALFLLLAYNAPPPRSTREKNNAKTSRVNSGPFDDPGRSACAPRHSATAGC